MADELKDQRIPIMMSPSEVKAIDDWMFASRIKSRSEAVRRLCQVGLAASEDLDKVKNSLQQITDPVLRFVKDNESNDFKKLGVHKQLEITKFILRAILLNIAEPAKMIANIYDIVHAYKTWELPEELGFQEGKTIIEAINYLRSKQVDEDKLG